MSAEEMQKLFSRSLLRAILSIMHRRDAKSKKMQIKTLLSTTLICASCLASSDTKIDQLVAHVQTYKSTWYPPNKAPESTKQRLARWDMLTRIAWEEAQKNAMPLSGTDQVALTLSIWKFESSLDFHVHAGKKSPLGHQDHGRAVCLGQLQHVKAWWSEDDWRALAGTSPEATARCARATLKALNYHLQRCGLRRKQAAKTRWERRLALHEAAILFTAYGTGTHCKESEWKGTRQNLNARVNEFYRLRKVLH